MKKIEKIALITFALVLAIELIAINTADKQEKASEEAAKAEMLHRIDTLRDENLKITNENQRLREELRKKDTSDRGGEREPTLTSLGTYTLTAYCSCEKCCGKWARIRNGGKVTGAAGVELIPGISVASPLPLGTELMIDGHRYVVQDRTAGWIVDRYDGKIIDIYFDRHEAALEWGKQTIEVYAVR